MMPKNENKPLRVADTSYGLQIPQIGISNLIEVKYNAIEALRGFIKNNITITLSQNDQVILIKTDEKKQTRAQRETVKLTEVNSYINEMHDKFYKEVDKDDLHSSYALLLKTKAIIGFLFKANKTVISSKEWIIANLNEIIFLQSNGLYQLTGPIYNSVMNCFKSQSKLNPKTSLVMLSNKQFFNYLKPVFEFRKLKLRTLLSLCLSLSERFEHQQAIKKARRAFNTAADLLLTTLLVAYHSLLKNIEKAEDDKNQADKSKIFVKIEYFTNLISLLKGVIKSIDEVAVSNLKKSDLLDDIYLYEDRLKRLKEKVKRKDEPYFFIAAEESQPKSDHNGLNINIPNCGTRGGHENSVLDSDINRITKIMEKYADGPDLMILNNKQVLESSPLTNTTILNLSQLDYYNYTDVFVTDDLNNEITETSILEKIAFVAVSLYALATEHRFLENAKNVGNTFYKFLGSYMNNASDKKSEIYLTKAVELAILYLSDTFPFVSQIFCVYSKFELNRSKCIPENHEEEGRYEFVQPFKNGFRSALVIPVIKVHNNRGSSIFENKEPEAKKPRTRVESASAQKKTLESKRLTSSTFFQRNSSSKKRTTSSEQSKYRPATAFNKSDYFEKIKQSIQRKDINIPFNRTSDGFFTAKKVRPSKSIKLKGKSNKPSKKPLFNNNSNAERIQSALNQSKSVKIADLSINRRLRANFSPLMYKYISGKVNSATGTKAEPLLKDTHRIVQPTISDQVLRVNRNKINANRLLNGVTTASKTTEVKNHNNSPKCFGKPVPSKNTQKVKENIRKVFSDKTRLDEILNRFKYRNN